MKRSRAREVAFILVYESLFLKKNADDLILQAKEVDFLSVDEYVKNVVFGVLEKKNEIDEKIKLFLKNWKIERISEILLAILEVSIYEILYVEEVDFPISINEAVELSKKFFGGDGPAFVNGVLGGFVKSIK